MNEINTDILEKVNVLPDKPGVYQFYDTKGEILYIGKAKNLRKRVSSYFQKKSNNFKEKVLVEKIQDLQHIVVDSESEALLLENNLIKKNQPRYNVLLKDDKTFPWICIKNEPFPRVFLTRKIVKDGSEYFGPYTSAGMVRSVLNLIKQLYQLRTCKYILSEDNIVKKKFRACLEYHIGNCKAPCIGLQEHDDYLITISQIRNILKGNLIDVIKELSALMRRYADEFKFEEANFIKEQLEGLKKFREKSTIVSPRLSNLDVFSIISTKQEAYVNFLKVMNGAVVQSHMLELKKKLHEDPDELLLLAITEIRSKIFSNAREMIVPFKPSFNLENVKFVVPARGEKRKLLELSERNAKYYKIERQKQKDNIHKKHDKERILLQLKKDLRLNELPVHIECFDNSNIQGTNPVAACVVFRGGKPSKKEYRHFHIRTVTGADDFMSMKEIVNRRYKRLRDEKISLPQLIVIDGGKGQLNAALQALKELDIIIPIIGIAKKLEEIYFPGDPVPLYLDKNSESLKIIQNLRNEAHRFGISFHRDTRSRVFLNNELENIKGIGPETIELLLKNFGSVKNMRFSSLENMEKIIGNKKALLIYNYFNNK